MTSLLISGLVGGLARAKLLGSPGSGVCAPVADKSGRPLYRDRSRRVWDLLPGGFRAEIEGGGTRDLAPREVKAVERDRPSGPFGCPAWTTASSPGSKPEFEPAGDTIRVRPRRVARRTRPDDGYGMLKYDRPGQLATLPVVRGKAAGADFRLH